MWWSLVAVRVATHPTQPMSPVVAALAGIAHQ
jgi:hypothetical protein